MLHGGEASKLAGFLNFLAQHAFKRLGRALIRPIFSQARSASGRVGKELQLALEWWQQVLDLELNEFWRWSKSVEPPIHLFADARSTPPRVAAVLVDGQEILWCDMQPTDELVQQFVKRADGQIMMLELLAIALGTACVSPHDACLVLLLSRPVRVRRQNSRSEIGSLERQ